MKNILVLATGGTIAGSASSATIGAYKYGDVLIEQLLAGVPELKGLANIKADQISNIGSENMTLDIWLSLAKKINTELAKSDVDGIVITHGTDTLGETSYFLNLVVKSDKPVVLVGAMRPSTAMSADGPRNLYDAVLVASNDASKGKGVMVVMNSLIHAARDIVKTHTTNVDAFADANVGSLGYVHSSDVEFYRAPMKKHTYQSEFDISDISKLPYVSIVYGYAGVDDVAISAYLEHKVEGIVYAAVGNGSLTSITSVALQKAIKMGVIAVRASRVHQGPVTDDDWGDGYRGIIPSDTLTPYKARVLLMLALTKTKDASKIKEYFKTY